MRKTVKRLACITLGLVACASPVTNASAPSLESMFNGKGGAYSVDKCIPTAGGYDYEEWGSSYNLCTPQAGKLFEDVVRKTKINFANSYIFTMVKVKEKEGHSAYSYHMAINPKTKKVYVLPYAFMGEKGNISPVWSYSLKSNKVCTKTTGEFLNEGNHITQEVRGETVCFPFNTQKTEYDDIGFSTYVEQQ